MDINIGIRYHLLLVGRLTTGLAAYIVTTRILCMDLFVGLVCFAITFLLFHITVQCLIGRRKQKSLSNEPKKKKRKKPVIKFDECKAYARQVLAPYLMPAEIEIILRDIENFAVGADRLCPILSSASEGYMQLTSKDLFHFGWNVGKRLGKSGDEIAWFLKNVFPVQLRQNEHTTIVRKLTSDEGAFSIPLIPLNQSLIINS